MLELDRWAGVDGWPGDQISVFETVLSQHQSDTKQNLAASVSWLPVASDVYTHAHMYLLRSGSDIYLQRCRKPSNKATIQLLASVLGGVT
jgi:hypothetical protein